MLDSAKLTSLQNPKVKHVVKLRDRRTRDRERLTLLEGYRELTRAHEYGMELSEAYYCPEMFLGANEVPFLEQLQAANVELYEVTAPILKKMAYRERPEGLIAIAGMRDHRLADIPVVENGLYLIAEAVEKPGNLGSIMRSADAVGANGVIVCDRRTDIYNPNVIRASTGAIFSVPLAECSVKEAAAWLAETDTASIAATPHTDMIYTDVDCTRRIAILVGAEQYGLSDFWLENADFSVRIPMLGQIDSLNVSTATTILLYEAARQRQWQVAGAEAQAQ